MTVSEAAAAGDKRALLVAMQSRIAGAIDCLSTHPRDLAQLTRRQMEISNELRALDATEGADKHLRSALSNRGAEPFDYSTI